MELDMFDALLISISKDSALSEVSVLHHLVTSREIEDIENINLKTLCETIWITLLRCWSIKEFTEKEHLVWETVSWLLSLPTFTSSEECIRQIGDTITKAFCNKCKTQLKDIEPEDMHFLAL
jgi:hypothetical protein